MRKYGIWKVILQTVSGETIKQEVTATSGKDAKARIEKLYEGCEVFKMIRVEWLNGFSYAQLSPAIMGVCPTWGQALLDILTDNGVFFSGKEADEKLD